MYTIELTEAERNFLLAVWEHGVKAMGIPTLFDKLRGMTPNQAPAPAEAVEAPAAE